MRRAMEREQAATRRTYWKLVKRRCTLTHREPGYTRGHWKLIHKCHPLIHSVPGLAALQEPRLNPKDVSSPSLG
jgi:hypothetical protein